MPSLFEGLFESFSIICFYLGTFHIEVIHIFAETRFLPIWTIFHWEIISDLFASEFYSEFLNQLKALLHFIIIISTF